jgi:hypothetical protein
MDGVVCMRTYLNGLVIDKIDRGGIPSFDRYIIIQKKVDTISFPIKIEMTDFQV